MGFRKDEFETEAKPHSGFLRVDPIPLSGIGCQLARLYREILVAPLSPKLQDLVSLLEGSPKEQSVRVEAPQRGDRA